jgi:branched-subunit amino acid transport protein
MSGETDLWTLGVVVGLTVITVITRCLFFISSRPWTLARWAQRGLQYAPIAALSAVIVPEIVLSGGTLSATVLDARLWGAVAGAGFFFWQREGAHAVLGTIVVGMGVYLPLRLMLGW